MWLQLENGVAKSASLRSETPGTSNLRVASAEMKLGLIGVTATIEKTLSIQSFERTLVIESKEPTVAFDLTPGVLTAVQTLSAIIGFPSLLLVLLRLFAAWFFREKPEES